MMTGQESKFPKIRKKGQGPTRYVCGVVQGISPRSKRGNKPVIPDFPCLDYHLTCLSMYQLVKSVVYTIPILASYQPPARRGNQRGNN